MTLTSCSQPCIVRHFSTSISSPFSALSIYISMYVYIYVHIPLYKLSSHIIIVFSRCSRPPPLPTLNCFCCSDRFLLFLFFLFLRSCSPFHFSFPLPKRQRVLYVVSFCLTAQTTLLLLLCFFFFIFSLSLSRFCTRLCSSTSASQPYHVSLFVRFCFLTLPDSKEKRKKGKNDAS